MKFRFALAGIAAILVAAIIVFVLARTPQAEPAPMATIEPETTEEELVDAPVAFPFTEAERRKLVAEESPIGVSTVAGTKVLRVTVDGIAEEEIRLATVTLKGVDKDDEWIADLRDSWPCQGPTSEFDLDPFFARVAAQNLRVDQLWVEVNHPHYFIEATGVPVSDGVKLTSGQTVYEARLTFTPPVFWPEFTLAVRDARTRAHLQDVEIRCAPRGLMGLWRRPGNAKLYTPIGEGLASPIALLGGHEADDPETRVAALALSPAAGEAPQFVELMRLGRELVVYARAPGYAWDSIHVDVSSGDEYEVLLGPDSMLTVQLVNVRLERYAAIEMKATLGIHQLFPSGNESHIWFQDIDQTLAVEGLRLDGLKPSDYSVFVKLDDRWSRSKQPELAREKVSLAVGKPRELVLRLDDPPKNKRQSATLAGVVSFPPFEGGYEWVRLDLLEVKNSPISMLTLADMERIGDTPDTWSFRGEDLPEGLYQFLLPDQIQTYQQTGVRFEGEPGRFRFWTTPGAAFIQTYKMPSGHDYGLRRMDLELVAGRQSVRLQLGPRYPIRLMLRENGEAPPPGSEIYWGAKPNVRAVEHEGHVVKDNFIGNRIMEMSAPGLYEVSFDDVTAHHYQSIPPRLVHVLAGETAEVIVELQRK